MKVHLSRKQWDQELSEIEPVFHVREGARKRAAIEKLGIGVGRVDLNNMTVEINLGLKRNPRTGEERLPTQHDILAALQHLHAAAVEIEPADVEVLCGGRTPMSLSIRDSIIRNPPGPIHIETQDAETPGLFDALQEARFAFATPSVHEPTTADEVFVAEQMRRDAENILQHTVDGTGKPLLDRKEIDAQDEWLDKARAASMPDHTAPDVPEEYRDTEIEDFA